MYEVIIAQWLELMAVVGEVLGSIPSIAKFNFFLLLFLLFLVSLKLTVYLDQLVELFVFKKITFTILNTTFFISFS